MIVKWMTIGGALFAILAIFAAACIRQPGTPVHGALFVIEANTGTCLRISTALSTFGANGFSHGNLNVTIVPDTFCQKGRETWTSR